MKNIFKIAKEKKLEAQRKKLEAERKRLEEEKKKRKILIITSSIVVVFFIALSLILDDTTNNEDKYTNATTDQTTYSTYNDIETTEKSITTLPINDTTEITTSLAETEETTESISQLETTSELTVNTDKSTFLYNNKSYTIIIVDGGNRSGSRQPNVAVNIGFGDRVYWGLTNEYGQLVTALADKIILQDDYNEPVNSNGRYYDDEANVPGTERSDLDQGHVIADSLGGVSNAYNITPQDSSLNRYGDQAYMEKAIRNAGGCTNFVATITYPNTSTQIPSHYHFEYDLKGNHIVDDFDNANPEGSSSSSSSNSTSSSSASVDNPISVADEQSELAIIDSNGNGIVTIAEAKAAGYKMPVTSKCWLYKYMKDADGDGMVGE